MTGPGARLERRGAVGTITVRPAAAQDPWAGIRAIGHSLPGDVRVVVLRIAAGGLDVPVDPSSDLSEAALQRRIGNLQEAVAWFRRPDLVSVAAVAEPTTGAAFQAVLACDLRVMAGGTWFAVDEVRDGSVPGLGATRRLVELVGYSRALEISLTARRVDAAEAYRIGLASLVVPPSDLDAAVADLVSALLAAPRGAASELKSLLMSAAEVPYREQLDAERDAWTRRVRDLADLGE